jgi:diguanylate cyclase (GGDEF)-like protein
MNSLKNKIFLLLVSILLVVQAIAFWTLYNDNKNQEMAEINNRLTTANTIFTELFQRRLEYLAAFSNIAAQDYTLKSMLDGRTRELLITLNNHRSRINSDLAMTISNHGVITGQLQRISTDKKAVYQEGLAALDDGSVKIGSEIGTQFRYQNWFTSAQSSHIYQVDSALYQVNFSPVNDRNKIVGWLMFGFAIDQHLANEFKSITNLQTDFILKTNNNLELVASSEANNESNFTNHDNSSFTQLLNEQETRSEAAGNLTKYIATYTVITEWGGQELGVYMYSLRANIVSLLQEQWGQLLLLGLITLIISLASAYLIAASISKPINRLVEHAKAIASGNFKQTIQFKETNEVGQLAHEFNNMQLALSQREDAITRLANYDLLTNLPNRNCLYEALVQLQDKRFMLLHLNMSRLKDVNATLGYEVGDLVIKALAERLQAISVEQHVQLLVHLRADEFILIVDTIDVAEMSAQINKELEEIFCFQGISLQMQVRIGIALYPEHTDDITKIEQMADTALHHTRTTRSLIQIYQPELDVNSVERLNLINDLRQAISTNQLELHFQPKLCLSTWKITHVEALVRWQHPKLGMIPPDNFIYIAEQTGHIEALTRWVLKATLIQSCEWKKLGLNLNIAVNISAENLKEPDFYDFVCNSLNFYQVSPTQITLEVTESSVVEDHESAIQLLGKFKKFGIKISIDDYGTGYSSLAQLKYLPVHELKIDKSFIQRIENDIDDQIIVRSTIDLAHNMGLNVVAEGIEDEFALSWLADYRCELAQGYFISHPKPASELTPWLMNPPIFKQYSSLH